MQSQQNYLIRYQPTTSNLHITEPLTSTTSLLSNSPVQLSTSTTTGRTTAAIIPSTTFQGVDIVIYEAIDNEQQL
jgi:hypothetical protein